MKGKLYSLLLAGMLGVMSTSAMAAVRYVTVSGNGDGSSWTNASGDIQAMIDASEAGDEVWIAKGTYKPEKLIRNNKPTSKAFILKDGVSLIGGFAGSETETDARERVAGGERWDFVNETILSADDDVADVWEREFKNTYRLGWKEENNQVIGTSSNSTHVLYQANAIVNLTKIDGLTLKGGNANVYQVKACGGALYAIGNVVLRRCKVVENSGYFKAQSITDSNTYGGAVYLKGGEEAAISYCYFARNFSHSSYGNSYGGAVYAENVNISNSTFEDCVSNDAGGAVAAVGGGINNCIFKNCYGGIGGAVYLQNATAEGITVTDCRGLKGGAVYSDTGKLLYSFIYNNYADAPEYGDEMGGQGGGIYALNCTVADNVIYNNTSFVGGGVYVRGAKLYNNTIQNNSLRAESTLANVGFAEGSDASSLVNTIYATDVAASNFVKASDFNGFTTDTDARAKLDNVSYELTENSEFVDSGEKSEEHNTEWDIIGNDRIQGNGIDRGAYESSYSKEIIVEEKPAITITFETGTASAKLGVGGKDGTAFTIDWGDGNKEEYNKADYYTGELKSGTVKIYGKGISVLLAPKQNITAVDLSGAKDLSRIMLGQNKLSKLDVTNNINLTGIYAEQNAIDALNLSNNTALRVLDVHDNRIQGTIDCSRMIHLSKVDIADNLVEVLNLPHHSTVFDVDCSNNKLSSIDLDGLSGLEELSVSGNSLSELDLTGLTALKELYAYNNNLKELDATPATALKTLNVAGNEELGKTALERIDISKNTALEGLYLYENSLTSLDLSNNRNIRWLNVEGNKLQELNTKNMSNLSLLLASRNRIKEIDLSGNPSLSQVKLASNLLKTIDVSHQPNLSWLKIDNNQLKEIDVHANKYLYWMECGDNKLTTLKLEKNTYLQWLAAERNNIASLDLSHNTGLQGLTIQDNKLTTESLNTIIAGLQDVNGVEITDNNRTFARILNISNMPGTKNANVAEAISKGWKVTAEVTTGISTIGDDSIVGTTEYYSVDGKRLASPSQHGVCIEHGVNADGKKTARKIINRK